MSIKPRFCSEFQDDFLRFFLFGLLEQLRNHFFFLRFISIKKASVGKFSTKASFEGFFFLTNNIIPPALAFRSTL